MQTDINIILELSPGKSVWPHVDSGLRHMYRYITLTRWSYPPTWWRILLLISMHIYIAKFIHHCRVLLTKAILKCRVRSFQESTFLIQRLLGKMLLHHGIIAERYLKEITYRKLPKPAKKAKWVYYVRYMIYYDLWPDIITIWWSVALRLIAFS
jgi:hypothetical protein